MKFKCKICGTEVMNISVSKQYLLRDDFHFSHGTYSKIDTEYFDCDVKCLIYECECGESVIKNENVIDFLRNSDSIRPEDIKQSEYGDLLVEK